MITTEAWILDQGLKNGSVGKSGFAGLKKGAYSFAEIKECEALVEPIFGCWESNMTHAINRQPIDICQYRGEERVVIGNAGVVRVLKPGGAVTGLNEGDLCIVFCNGVWDEHGYAKRIYAYDAPNTVGVLAKQTKLHEKQLIPIPRNTLYSLKQWAAFSLRYITAWANWKMAYGCLRLQLSEQDVPSPYVWAWGGGVGLAEICLAKMAGCRTAMISSDDKRLEFIRQSGIQAIDRRMFGSLSFNSEKYKIDAEFKKAYLNTEERFLDVVREYTRGLGVSIFIDFIGFPVYRATLKALARPGIITTAGWKEGMNLSIIRAIECMNWHTHVHTHYARYFEALEAVRFAEENEWMPVVDSREYSWDEVPQLALDYAEAKISSYFPIFNVNNL